MRTNLSKTFQRSVVAAAAVMSLSSAGAADLLSGFGGAFDFGERAMVPNDDGSSNRLDLPFEINFFGSTFNTFFVNNNGNITFNSPLGSFTPTAFPVSNQPMIAPWWADVDTRGGVPSGNPASQRGLCGLAECRHHRRHLAQRRLLQRADQQAQQLPARAAQPSRHRCRQLRLRLPLPAAGVDHRRAPRVASTAWAARRHRPATTTGAAPASSRCPARARRTSSTSSTPATCRPRHRGCGPSPCATARPRAARRRNPLLPVVVDGSYSFDFNVILNQTVFIDPEVAVGYDYALAAGSTLSFQSVVLPNIGDGQFNLYLWDGTQYVADGTLQAGVVHTFAGGGVTRFSHRRHRSFGSARPQRPPTPSSPA